MNIICASMKGGVGKSTVACTLAVSLADTKFKVLLADLDSEQGSTIKWAARRLDRDIKPRIACEQYHGVEACLKAGEAFDHVIVDLKPRGRVTTGELAHQGDLIIIPTGPSLGDIQPASMTMHSLARQKEPKAMVAVVLVGVGSIFEEARAKNYLDTFHVDYLENVIPERRSYRYALDRGLALTENLYGDLASHAEDVMDEIKGLMEKASGSHGKVKNWKLKAVA